MCYPKTLVRRWGRIGGKRPRSLRRVMRDAEEVRQAVRLIRQRRLRHGYHRVQELHTGAISAPAA